MLWEYNTSELLTMIALISALSYITSWMVDRIMGKAGFGPIGNWAVILAGTFTGILAFNIYGYDLAWYPMFSLIIVTSCTLFMFVSLCVIKRLTSL